jgi:ATP-dependent RNA helicase DeaD
MTLTTSFNELGLNQDSLHAIQGMGFTSPSPIQATAIPKILRGADLIGQAQTGTGKTAAFGLPILESIDESELYLQAIVLCPTRELALQVAREFQRIAGTRKRIKILPVFGGDSIQKQIKALREGTHIVVGTPGRVMDLMDRKILNLSKIRFAIMDEADEMLNMGFRDDMVEILKNTPSERQTILFSATMSPPILEIANTFLRNPETARVTSGEVTNSMIEQTYYETTHSDKPKLLASLVRHLGLKSVIVFCNMKKSVDDTVLSLKRSGLKADAIHGDLNQNQRNQVLGAFRTGTLSVLVATDVAARGIDVSHVDAVFNFDIPQDRESYVHRIGRTGRAGRKGLAISFVTNGSDLRKIRMIEKFSKVDMKRKQAPSAKEIRASFIRQFQEMIEKVKSEETFSHHRKLVEEVKEAGLNLEDLLAYYLKQACPLDVVDRPQSIREPSSSEGGFSRGGKPGRFQKRGRSSHSSGRSEKSSSSSRSPSESKASSSSRGGSGSGSKPKAFAKKKAYSR